MHILNLKIQKNLAQFIIGNKYQSFCYHSHYIPVWSPREKIISHNCQYAMQAKRSIDRLLSVTIRLRGGKMLMLKKIIGDLKGGIEQLEKSRAILSDKINQQRFNKIPNRKKIKKLNDTAIFEKGIMEGLRIAVVRMEQLQIMPLGFRDNPPDEGDLIVIEFPPEQMQTPEVVTFSKETEWVDGCIYYLIKKAEVITPDVHKKAIDIKEAKEKNIKRRGQR